MANRGGFSWKRFLGISRIKSNISRKIGIPLTRSGRQRKFGKAMGCMTMIMLMVFIVCSVLAIVLIFAIS